MPGKKVVCPQKALRNSITLGGVIPPEGLHELGHLLDDLVGLCVRVEASHDESWSPGFGVRRRWSPVALVKFLEACLDGLHFVLHLLEFFLVPLGVHREAVDAHGRFRELGLNILFQDPHSLAHLSHGQGEFLPEEVPDASRVTPLAASVRPRLGGLMSRRSRLSCPSPVAAVDAPGDCGSRFIGAGAHPIVGVECILGVVAQVTNFEVRYSTAQRRARAGGCSRGSAPVGSPR